MPVLAALWPAALATLVAQARNRLAAELSELGAGDGESADEGEALWALGEAPPAVTGACLYRQGQAQWLPTRANAPRWALARLRLQAPGQAATFALSVRRGAQAVSLQADEQGHVRADAEALRTLNRDEGGQLLLRAQASCAGRLQLSRLRVACR